MRIATFLFTLILSSWSFFLLVFHPFSLLFSSPQAFHPLLYLFPSFFTLLFSSPYASPSHYLSVSLFLHTPPLLPSSSLSSSFFPPCLFSISLFLILRTPPLIPSFYPSPTLSLLSLSPPRLSIPPLLSPSQPLPPLRISLLPKEGRAPSAHW